MLECPVTFTGTSPYHKKNPLTFLFQTDSTVNPMRFAFKFPFKFSDSGRGDAQVFTPQGAFSGRDGADGQWAVFKYLLQGRGQRNRGADRCA